MSEPLTPEQIENWRKVLLMQVGPYALLMTAEQIQKTRDNLQSQVAPASPAKPEGEVGR